ncbi:Ribulose kinase [Marinovum algicola DG 898]|nr:Ribulose kinase [Marinovum algicola DG 898]
MTRSLDGKTIAITGAASGVGLASGGAAASPLIKQPLADATGIATAEPATSEPVLLGSAMLGAVASGRFDTLMTAMAAMSRIARRFDPAQGRIRALHDRRYRRFTALQAAAGAGAEGAV